MKAAARAGARPVPSGEALAVLLSNIAEAPDFAGAALLLLEQFARAAGSDSAALYVAGTEGRLERVQRLGGDGWSPGDRAETDADHSPALGVAAFGLEVVVCRPDGVAHECGAKGDSVSIPVPQAPRRGAPARAVQPPDALLPGCCEVFHDAPGGWRTAGRHAPFAAVVLGGKVPGAVLTGLAHAARLAGPVLARSHMADAYRRTAERLDERRNLLTTMLDALPDPIVITDGANDVIVQNRRAEMLLATGQADSEGRRRAVEINNLLFSSFLSKSVLAGASTNRSRELNLVDPGEGSDLLFEVLAHPLPPAVGREGAAVSVLRDVTDLKRASIELERQFARARVTELEATRERDRLDLILSNVGDPILVTDGQSKIVLMNPQAEQLFELPAGRQDRAQAQRVRGNDTKFMTLISDFAISSDELRTARATLVQPSTGVEVPMEVVAGKVLNARGEPLAIVSVLHDLTKHAENERLNAELKALNADLEGRIRLATTDLEAQNLRLQWQASELEKAYRLKSEFLANMSHELRTPINALIGYAALMLDRIYGDLTVKQTEGLRRIQASSQHLLALINDILDLSKIEAGKMPVHLEPVLLRPLVEDVMAQIEQLATRRSLELIIDIDEALPPLYSDRTKLQQIILNLLSNAVKFTHQGSVGLAVHGRDGHVEIRVADTGIGIRPEHLAVIFEEFRQVDQSRTREYGGTGLGLSITRKLVRLLGGSIAVASEFGQGSTFTVMLPVRSDAPAGEDEAAGLVIGGTRPA